MADAAKKLASEPVRRSSPQASASDAGGASERPQRDIGTRRGGPSRQPQRESAPRRPSTSRSGGGSRTPQRPRSVKAGGGARLLAPLAIVIFAIAGFVAVTSSGSDNTPDRGEQTSTERSGSNANSNANDADSGGATITKTTYRVKAGDSFAAIAEKLNIDVNTLSELNPDIDPRALQPGQKLKLK